MNNCAGCDVPLTDDNTYTGITKWCRACWRAKVRARRKANPAVQEYDRNRAKTPERKALARKVAKEWRENNPDGYKAHTAVGNALRDGKLTKGPCMFCNTDKHIHAHHRDYSRPLDVDWVCAKCHHRLHALLEAS